MSWRTEELRRQIKTFELSHPRHSQLRDWMRAVLDCLTALEEASGERAASPASSPTMASPTTDSHSDALGGLTAAQTRPSLHLLGEVTAVERTHVARCSECQARLVSLWDWYKTRAQDAAGITSTYQSPASLQYVDAMAPAQSPSSESIELKRPTLVLDENAGTAPVGIDSSVGPEGRYSGRNTVSVQHEHEWRHTGQRNVRVCDADGATQMQSLASGRWHDYLAADPLAALESRAAALQAALAELMWTRELKLKDVDSIVMARKLLSSVRSALSAATVPKEQS